MGDGLRAHLEGRYGVPVAAITPLDQDVYRVDREGGPPWVARVFPARSEEAVEGDAAVLRGLEASGFPAERCACPDPVSSMEGAAVLVTALVEGERAPGSGRTLAILGALLGRLHARTDTRARPGGAWHHLSPDGGPAEALAAAQALWDAVRAGIGPGEAQAYDAVWTALADAEDGAELPHAFVHPDFVPANAIATGDGSLVIVDWAGAGRGPRLPSLGFLLFAAGVRDVRLVDAAVSRYARHVALEPAELDRLEGAIRLQPLLIDCWAAAHGRKTVAEVAAGVRFAARVAGRIGERAAAGLSGEAGEPGQP